jgi:hypothetical protein
MFLLHSGFEWIFSGLVVFVGLMVFFIKLSRGKIMECASGLAVWWFVYSIHGMSTQGIMSATFAALLFDLVGWSILKLASRRW